MFTMTTPSGRWRTAPAPIPGSDRPDADPSPLSTPRAARPSATRVHARPKAAYVQRRPLGTSTSAHGRGTRRSPVEVAADGVAQQGAAPVSVGVGRLGGRAPAARLIGSPPRGTPCRRRAGWASRSSIRRILPETVLGSSANSAAGPALYGASTAGSARTRLRGLAVRCPALGQHTTPLAPPAAPRPARAPPRLGDRLVLQQRALQLEGRDLVVGGLKNVIGTTDVGDVAVGSRRMSRVR